ncbi:MAG: bifunctional [glutamine synthetase] adenylyltransferase/[glutamine synthetase]-adenylyl-L-tyrosine phosphorylase, partial [Brachybacterium sp.]|nr:bifunctional [glutamine synthetase] adenylyltransferase/[glutamine synthetase]-adenylyl-L-tyrosine phosphorylase [Brachybacterium sp.]
MAAQQTTDRGGGASSAPTAGKLARMGFSDTKRAVRFLEEEPLARLPEDAIRAIGSGADGDEALLVLLRIAEAAAEADDTDLPAVLRRMLEEAGDAGTPGSRLVQLAGASVALGDFLARHPEKLASLEDLPQLDENVDQVRRHLLEAVGADPAADVPVAQLEGREARDALRIAYHERLVQIAAADVTGGDPTALEPQVSRALADLAGAALEAALAVARGAVEGHEQVRLAVLAMGKTGARELNYISDVDVLYVAEHAETPGPGPGSDGDADEDGDHTDAGGATGSDEETYTRVAAALCRELARVCADRTAEGSLWQVDANLRPEGKDGPLTRSLESYRRYYTTWAESWEFQALLKARHVAGDARLGEQFEQMVGPDVWEASARDGFVEDTRAMRRRVIDHIPRGEVERNVKLGPGGLRDVEFTVQLLQMVHGRTDESLRVRGTLEALERLRDGGYIGRDGAAELEEAYRFLRTVEHRLQLHRMRRTQVLPTSAQDVRRLARGLRMASDDFQARYERTRRRVRGLHEEIFYRPLLVTASNLSAGEVQLSAEAARSRLAAIGYRDPARAIAHIESLTEGISRRAAIQRQLLPSMLEWFADGIDPDMGLLAFRRLSDELGSAHWYLGLLRDSGVAAQRLTRILSSSRFVGEQLEQIPQAVRWLGRDSDLQPLDRQALAAEFDAVIRRVDGPADATEVLRRTRRRELLRVSMAQLVHLVDAEQVACALTDIAEAVLDAGVRVAVTVVERELAEDTDSNSPPTSAAEDTDGDKEKDDSALEVPAAGDTHSGALGIEVAVIAQGSFGAAEMGYSSDADVQFVVADRGAGNRTGEIGIKVATQVQKILNAPSSGADMKVSADLRPEGRSGVLARSVTSWREYYRKNAETWEKQALLRARVVVGGEEITEELTAVMDTHRYPHGGLGAAERRKIVTMKARVESERLPRGADPNRHLKLGRGGMTDVEWVVQLLVMEHGHENPELHRTGTLSLLSALHDLGLLARSEADDLQGAWLLAWSIRRALFLWRGREGEVLPTDRNEMRAVARVVDGEGGT